MKSGRARLRDWIDRSKANQREAAIILGISEVFLSQILNGVRTPGLDNAVKIEQVTGVSVESWLVSELSEAADGEAALVGKRKSAKR